MTSSLKSVRNKLIFLSGGQTGTDRAVLDFAMAADIQCSGWCPGGRSAEDGTISPKYPLQNCFSQNPDVRTELNVISSDGTLIILYDHFDRGTCLTHDLAQLHNKPLFIWKISLHKHDTEYRHKFFNWIKKNNITCLNIAGPRESNSPGIYLKTQDLLFFLFFE